MRRLYRMQEAQLRLWVEAAEETLRREERFQCVSDLLLWAKTEFRRRCRYLGQEEPPLERRAGELLRALADSAAGAQTQRDQKNVSVKTPHTLQGLMRNAKIQ